MIILHVHGALDISVGRREFAKHHWARFGLMNSCLDSICSLPVADPWEGVPTSKIVVDTTVWGHSGKTRNSTNSGLQFFTGVHSSHMWGGCLHGPHQSHASCDVLVAVFGKGWDAWSNISVHNEASPFCSADKELIRHIVVPKNQDVWSVREEFSTKQCVGPVAAAVMIFVPLVERLANASGHACVFSPKLLTVIIYSILLFFHLKPGCSCVSGESGNFNLCSNQFRGLSDSRCRLWRRWELWVKVFVCFRCFFCEATFCSTQFMVFS